MRDARTSNRSGTTPTNQDLFDVPGGLAGGATPVPIPNTEVKPSKADDTAAERQWESRTLPGFKKAHERNLVGLFFLKPVAASRRKSVGFIR
jgi:hypothetical protein